MKTWLASLGDRWLTFIHSIRFRLTLWFVLILALVLGVFSTFIYMTQRRNLRIDAVARLQAKFVQVQGYLGGGEWEHLEIDGSDVSEASVPLQGGDLLILVDTGGSVLGRWGAAISDPEAVLDALEATASQQPDASVYESSVAIVGQDKQATSTDYLFITSPMVHDSRLLGYLVIGSQSDLLSQERRLGISLGLGSLAMLAIAFLGGLWLSDRAMRPVTAIARAAQMISESDLGRRLNNGGRDELADLARTFDAMIARLQAAFDRQRRFVADASHELRTPLTIINLEIARALSGQRPVSEYRRAMEVVDAESGRMTRLVNDLMTLARMDSGQAILKFEAVDFGDVALEAFERMTPLAERRKITLEIGELPELRVSGDRQYLVQMISNLVENGIKYCDAGATVRVQLWKKDNQAILGVADTGPGIPAEHLRTLFDRFYRVDTARSHNDQPGSPSGSGLGLSIVSWIVHAHRGTIRVDSEVGKGTDFEVALPLA
jgi:heavy metal sensor kinase